MTATTGETIRGTVQRYNGSTVVLHERDEPLVISRYAKSIATMEGGDQVELGIDARCFVTSAVILNMPDKNNGHEPQEDGPEERRPLPSKDLQIIRESCIKSAAAFCASRPDLKSKDLFCLAEKMEAWVLR